VSRELISWKDVLEEREPGRDKFGKELNAEGWDKAVISEVR
jgi:hypothetical protein